VPEHKILPVVRAQKHVVQQRHAVDIPKIGLAPNRVLKCNFRELGRRPRADDLATEALADKARQQPAVVHVCVSEQHGGNALRVELEFPPVPLFRARKALVHPAINKVVAVREIVMQERTRAGDGADRAYELRSKSHRCCLHGSSNLDLPMETGVLRRPPVT
jgi:hypothetical protein